MLFTESQLGASNAFGILDEATYLTQSESQIRPQTIPVMEVARLGIVQIPFYAISELADSNGCGLLEAVAAVCSADGIDPQNAVVSMTESEVILYPEIAQELSNIVVSPISESDPVYQLCEAVVEAFMESNDESVFDELFTEGTIGAKLKWFGRGITQSASDKTSFLLHPMKTIRDRRADHTYDTRYKFNVNNTDSVKANAEGRVKALANAPHKFLGKIIDNLDSFKHKPRNVIAKKIASLRKIYSKFMERSQRYIDDERASVFRRAAFYITKAIDKLLGWLQDKANDVQYNRDKKK